VTAPDASGQRTPRDDRAPTSARVLVTGGSGFLGRPLVHALIRAGHDVVTVGRAPAATPGRRHIVADLLDPGQARAAVRQAEATHLVHLAWHVDHHDFWTSPLNDAWADASSELARLFLAAGGRQVVAAGSCAEYAPAGAAVLTEQSAVGPATAYGQAKVEAHRRISEACGSAGAVCTWARIFVPYGPGDHPQRLVPSLIDVFRGRRPAFRVSPADVRDFIHTDDVAGALVCLLQHGVGGAVNVSTGAPTTIAHLVQCVARACGADAGALLPDAGTAEPSGPADSAAWLVGQPSTLTRLGWTPVISLEHGLYSEVQADRGSC